jgi:hypothetical protein
MYARAVGGIFFDANKAQRKRAIPEKNDAGRVSVRARIASAEW